MYQTRLKRLQSLLKKHSLEAYLVEGQVNLYYLTGLELSAGKILVTAEEGTLFVDARYEERCQQASPLPTLLDKNHPFTDHLKEISRLGFNQELMSYGKVQRLKKDFEEASVPTELVPCDDLVLHLRSIKDEHEIECLKEAADLGIKGYDFVLSCLQEGITERQVVDQLEIFWKQQGGKGLAFTPIIAFGTHGSMPHYESGDVPLKQGDAVLIDIGVNLAHYHSDMTRVHFFGKVDPKIEEIYSIVLQAQEKALSFCKPGMCAKELDTCARDVIKKAGYGEAFTHSLGHGIGLEVHEQPMIKSDEPFGNRVLEEGMVITIEPGIYLKDIGGVRLEDTVIITANGHENLTTTPK